VEFGSGSGEEESSSEEDENAKKKVPLFSGSQIIFSRSLIACYQYFEEGTGTVI
jgi:hypothetical protein